MLAIVLALYLWKYKLIRQYFIIQQLIASRQVLTYHLLLLNMWMLQLKGHLIFLPKVHIILHHGLLLLKMNALHKEPITLINVGLHLFDYILLHLQLPFLSIPLFTFFVGECIISSMTTLLLLSQTHLWLILLWHQRLLLLARCLQVDRWAYIGIFPIGTYHHLQVVILWFTVLDHQVFALALAKFESCCCVVVFLWALFRKMVVVVKVWSSTVVFIVLVHVHLGFLTFWYINSRMINNL